MKSPPPHAPGPDERFVVRHLTHDDVPHWFHVYSTKPPHTSNSATTFNKGWGETRFAPATAQDGTVLHTYYAASTREGAYMESVLHDTPLGRPAFFDARTLDTSHLAKIVLPTPIPFVSLHSHDLPALRLTRQQLIDSLPADYLHTRAWSSAALSQRPDAVAIGYTSRRNDSARCLMLVQQRLPAPAFTVIEDACIGTTPALRREVLSLVSSLGISTL